MDGSLERNAEGDEAEARANMGGQLGRPRIVYHDVPRFVNNALLDGEEERFASCVFRHQQLPESNIDLTLRGWLNDPRLQQIVKRMRGEGNAEEAGNVYACTRFSGQHNNSNNNILYYL